MPSPGPTIVANTGTPVSILPVEPTAIVAPITKLAKKSKSSSPADGPTPAASTNLLQRPKLKSTAELVREMTLSYPETMSISLKNVVPTPASPPIATSMATSAVMTTSIMASVLAAEAAASDGSDAEDDSKDEDYKEPGISSKKAKVMWTSTLISDRNNAEFRNVNKTELLDRYFRDHSSGGGDGRRQRRDKIKDKETNETAAKLNRAPAPVRPPIDWYSSVQLPPIDFSVLDTLDEETEVDECDGGGSGEGICDRKLKKQSVESDSTTDLGKLLDSCVTGDDVDETESTDTKKDGVQWRSRLLKSTERGDRQVLAMPYVDIGLPDFIEYGYTDRQQYLAHWSER